MFLPAHPHAGLAGVGGGQLGRGALQGAVGAQHLGGLAGDVAVQLGELVQVHDAGGLHRARLLVDLEEEEGREEEEEEEGGRRRRRKKEEDGEQKEEVEEEE